MDLHCFPGICGCSIARAKLIVRTGLYPNNNFHPSITPCIITECEFNFTKNWFSSKRSSEF